MSNGGRNADFPTRDALVQAALAQGDFGDARKSKDYKLPIDDPEQLRKALIGLLDFSTLMLERAAAAENLTPERYLRALFHLLTFIDIDTTDDEPANAQWGEEIVKDKMLDQKLEQLLDDEKRAE